MKRTTHSKQNKHTGTVLVTAGLLVLASALALTPAARGIATNVSHGIADMFKAEFQPEKDENAFAIVLLDASPDSSSARRRIAEGTNSIFAVMKKQPNVTLFRYANNCEWIGNVQGSAMRLAINNKYVNGPVPDIPGTNLGQALEAAYKEFATFAASHPKAKLVLLIGSNASLDDPSEARAAAKKLESLKVCTIYFGGEARTVSRDGHSVVQARLIEETKYALEPINNLTVSTKEDFGAVLETITKKVN